MYLSFLIFPIFIINNLIMLKINYKKLFNNIFKNTLLNLQIFINLKNCYFFKLYHEYAYKFVIFSSYYLFILYLYAIILYFLK